MRKTFKKLFADHLFLELAVICNLLHFGLLLVLSVLDHKDYLYFALHTTSLGGVGELLVFLLVFLLPTILAFFFAWLLNRLDEKPRWLLRAAQAVTFVAMAGVMVYALLSSSVFSSMMPFASHTTKPENFGQYDKYVLQYLPTSNCPVSITEVPAGAENFDYSYSYIHTVDREWWVSASYMMEQAGYDAQKADMIEKMTAICTPEIATKGSTVTYATGDYIDTVGKAYTMLECSFDDTSREISFRLHAFFYPDGFYVN